MREPTRDELMSSCSGAPANVWLCSIAATCAVTVHVVRWFCLTWRAAERPVRRRWLQAGAFRCAGICAVAAGRQSSCPLRRAFAQPIPRPGRSPAAVHVWPAESRRSRPGKSPCSVPAG